jgi:hypothetical protein
MFPARPLSRFCLWLLFGAASGFAAAAIAPAEAGARPTVAALRDKYAQIAERLERSPYGRPLLLEARELDKQLQGDAYALVSQPFPKVQEAMAPAGNWCEMLMLPFNTKSCATGPGRNGERLTLFIGRKNDTPIESAFRLDFDYALAARTPDYLQLVLKSANGPLGTRDYLIVLEAIPVGEGRTFLHFRYNYSYGTLSRVAMQAYLATVGASKVGFTTERDGGGGQRLVGGMRGVMERNTMRYFLAIDAFLSSLDAPAATRLTQRLNDWFSGVERYPRQLQEDIGRGEYVAMKRRELARMAGVQRTAAGT